MCRNSKTCSELLIRDSWSIYAPLLPPPWIRSRLETLGHVIKAARAGGIARARNAVAAIRSDDILEWCVEHGQMSGIHRDRVLGEQLAAPTANASGPRNPSKAMCRAVWERDYVHCRYCGIPIIPKPVLVALRDALGADVFPVGRRNAECHGAALISWAQVDHVVPFNFGGATEPGNLVACCWACNYGKDRFTLEQLGLEDPRRRSPARSEWDGGFALLSR
jgi:hypothetical protein